MGRSIHGRRTENGMRYRVWSTVSDSYVTPVCTREELRAFLLDEEFTPKQARTGRADEQIAARIAVVDASGSENGDRDIDDPWHCNACQGAHHEFKHIGKASAECWFCGEPETAPCHGAAMCEETQP